jgi:DNA-binding beta-propeller fold protein YncE
VNIGKAFLAGGAVASLLTLMSAAPVLANGVGDLYVASSAGVIEVHVKTSTVVSTIPVVPAPQSLAFSPDGRTLYASSASAKVVPIDIATLDVQASITMPGPVSALAFPSGEVLVATMPTRRTLAFATVHGGAVVESSQLPGPGNILAGDRRDPRVAVAEAGMGWLDIVDPATSTMKKTTVSGGIVALAIDRDRGGVLVATQNPNSLIRVDLTSLANTWTVDLPTAPTAVASMTATDVVASDTKLLTVDGKTATAFATTREPAIVLTPSDEGSVVHVAESTGVEVFDAKGSLQRTLELKDDRAAVAMAAVPRGSSLFMGQGAAATAGASGTTAPNLATPEPPTTSTIVATAARFVGSPPVQGAGIVAAIILLMCWLVIRWYDRRATKPH